MKNFRVNNPNQEAYYEPDEVKHFWVFPGTYVSFKPRTVIQVTYA